MERRINGKKREPIKVQETLHAPFMKSEFIYKINPRSVHKEIRSRMLVDLDASLGPRLLLPLQQRTFS